MSKRFLATCAFATFLTLAAAAAFAQQDGPPRDNNGGPPNREQMQQRFNNMMKEQLGVTDEEWATLQPKIDAVRQLKRDASGQMGPPGGGPGGPGSAGGPAGGGPGGRGGPNGGGNDGPPPQDNGAQPQSDRRQGRDSQRGGDHKPSAVEQATRDLRDAVENDAAAAEIQAKVKALRDARATAKTSLTKAQTELQSLVTARQEAVLVSIGLLD